MKAKVVQKFNDRITKQRRNVGDIFECTDERFKELEKTGYVEAFKEPEQKTEMKTAAK